jgi:hypothetical protein
MGDKKSESNLSQVRDLIFGEQIKQNQQKFSAIDDRLDDLKNDILKLTEDAHQRFKQREKEAKKMQSVLESHIEKTKKEIKGSLESTRSQISKKIDQLIQEKSDRMQLGNLLIEMGMKIKGEDLMETLTKEVEANKDE